MHFWKHGLLHKKHVFRKDTVLVLDRLVAQWAMEKNEWVML